MKRLSMVMLILMSLSFVITFTSCETDTDDLTGPIKNNLPEITGIDASAATIPAGESVEVSVTAKNGDSYSWSADFGEFSDPTSSTTNWTSSGLSASSTVKLTCKVSNGSGSRNASVSVAAVFLTEPIHYWSFDSNKNSDSGLEAVGDGVTITTDAKAGAGAAAFPGGEDPANLLMVPDGNLPTGPEDVYSIAVWIKTEELGYAIFSRTADGVWDWEESSLKSWLVWEDYGYPTVASVAGLWNPIFFDDPGDWWDGEWHLYIMTHNASDLYAFYVDGEEIYSGETSYGDPTNEDGESVFTIGGGGWDVILNGTLDEYKYYDVVLGTAEISLMAAQ